nr:MAG: hypothetical protein [uncultured archaeon]
MLDLDQVRDNAIVKEIENIKYTANFVQIKCNGLGDRFCDWSRLFHLEGLKPENFKCPVCGCNSCTVKYFERIKPIWVFKLDCLMRKIKNMRYRLTDEYKEELRKKIEKRQKELDKWVKKEIEKRYTNDLLSGKITPEVYKEMLSLQEVK